MRQPKLDLDIKSLRKAQRGGSAEPVEEFELFRDVHTAMKQVEAGEILSNRAAKAELWRRLRG